METAEFRVAAGSGENCMTQSAPPDVGDRAQSFELQGVSDGQIETFTLESLTDGTAALIGIYAFDFSPVCTRQMCQLADMDWYQYKNDLSIVGVSTDGPYAHMEFAATEDITFPLLSDTGAEMVRDYGVLYEERDGFKNVAQRSLFLVDEEGVVTYRWVADDNWEESDFGVNPVGQAIEAL